MEKGADLREATEKGVKNVIIGLDPIIYFFVIQRFTKRDSRVEHGNDIAGHGNDIAGHGNDIIEPYPIGIRVVSGIIYLAQFFSWN